MIDIIVDDRTFSFSQVTLNNNPDFVVTRILNGTDPHTPISHVEQLDNKTFKLDISVPAFKKIANELRRVNDPDYFTNMHAILFMGPVPGVSGAKDPLLGGMNNPGIAPLPCTERSLDRDRDRDRHESRIPGTPDPGPGVPGTSDQRTRVLDLSSQELKVSGTQDPGHGAPGTIVSEPLVPGPLVPGPLVPGPAKPSAPTQMNPNIFQKPIPLTGENENKCNKFEFSTKNDQVTDVDDYIRNIMPIQTSDANTFSISDKPDIGFIPHKKHHIYSSRKIELNTSNDSRYFVSG
jgi:hypothetical protein